MLSPHPALFRIPESRTRTQGGDEAERRKHEEWERRKAFLMGKRFNGVLLCTIKSLFVTIDSRILYGIMKEICPNFDVSGEDFTGENRETYWKSIFDFKRLKVSKQKYSLG